MKRRSLIGQGLLAAGWLTISPRRALAWRTARHDALATLEQRHGGRLGVALMDTATGRRLLHRGDQRFLMCSTFKWLAVAAVLARVDAGTLSLQQRVVFDAAALLSHAPVTRQHVGGAGMSLAELCQAAITLSDNTAANLLLHTLGGPAAVTAFVRQRLGDPLTRLDRTEPTLNLAAPGDQRDTTTPAAMLDDLRQVLLGDVLRPGSRRQLLDWLKACSTGLTALRAGLPPGWAAGDKTGSGPGGERNDVAILLPPHRAPLLVAAYYVHPAVDDAQRNAVLAEVGRLAASLPDWAGPAQSGR